MYYLTSAATLSLPNKNDKCYKKYPPSMNKMSGYYAKDNRLDKSRRSSCLYSKDCKLYQNVSGEFCSSIL
jgi:hypothetical protein